MPLVDLLGSTGSITAPTYTTQGVIYDGSTNYVHRNASLTGAADGPLGIFSCWFNVQGSAGASRVLLRNPSTSTVNIQITSGNNIQVFLSDPGGANSFTFQTTNGAYSTAGWHNVMCAWDTNHAAGAKIGEMYVDGANVVGSVTDANAAFNIDYTVGDWGVGASANGTTKFNGYMAEVYFNSAEFLDLTNLVNRYKIRGITDHPADLGVTGANVTGHQPILYVKGPSANWATNLGSGGNLVVVGSFSDSPTNP